MSEVLVPRPAATCLLLRDGADGVEVLMLRRNPASVFVPNAHVFPGGAVEDADPDDRFAAVRETYEEAGLVVGDGPVERLAPFRSAVDHGELDFATLCREHGVTLRLEDLRPFGHWTTPLGAPRRYSTHFFVAPAPVDQVASHDGTEAVDGEWVGPQVALERFAAGEWELILPTERSLVFLTHFATTAEVLAHLDTDPPMTDDHGGRRVAVPQETLL
jgi:8-oxo-dGTP pyrophosphatase MutT (NUDIX family)